MKELLHFLLTSPVDAAPSEDASLSAWWDRQRPTLARWPSPFDRAAAGALAADRLGFAFAVGYRAALAALLPGMGGERVTSLCATEQGGAHPRAIKTRLARSEEDGRLRLYGKKRWATLASRADELLIMASIGEGEDGKNRLRAARIGVDRPGVHVLAGMPAPFAPEISHAEVELDGAPVDESEVLPGDAYELYLKPFRTIEDVHIQGSLLGYLIGVARRSGWPASATERLAAILVCARSIAEGPPLSPEVHVALAGLLGETRRFLEETSGLWSLVGEGERDRFARDRALLEVAGKARAARAERAWVNLRGE